MARHLIFLRNDGSFGRRILKKNPFENVIIT